MFVILSQRVDYESDYEDELFNIYHYPSRYKKQLTAGDIFIYYQGNRYNRKQRYYYGVGTISNIRSDSMDYYAQLSNCYIFQNKVPIYLPTGGYVEQLVDENSLKDKNPAWQNSIRPLSRSAFKYIIEKAGNLIRE